MPVYRPLIGFDKQEIVDVSEKIGTYETSILPFEDCCTIFVAKHPVTKPNINVIRNVRAPAGGEDRRACKNSAGDNRGNPLSSRIKDEKTPPATADGVSC